MALAVLDLDITDLPATLEGVDGYEGAVVLLRIAGVPSGQAVLGLPLPDATPLRELILASADSAFWESWLRHELGLPSDAPQPASLPEATVAICTRDRTEDLACCLKGLTAMPGETKILVIDNAPSTDDTRDLVLRYPTISYVREPKAGLDNARNTALASIDTEIIAFIDDDAAPDRAWLATLLRNFEDPMVLAATGLTLAMELESDAQIAFQRVGGFSRGFKRVVHDAMICDPFQAWHAGAGVNMALRRSVVDLVGPFDPALDAGTRALAGGDTDLFRRILQSGYRIAYDPQALNWHRHRRSMKELEQQVFGYEAAAFAIYTKALLFERDFRAVIAIGKWLRHQIPEVIRSRRRPFADLPFNVAATQARGAWSGPRRYLQARRIALQQVDHD